MIGSTFNTTAAGSKGVVLAASSKGGTGNFVNDTFNTADPSDVALLYAASCHVENNTRAVVPGCQSAPR